tara:strand:+ start:5128 stop:6630 length:1503 start_codon:yes stop_codon:yes gene_type:complete
MNSLPEPLCTYVNRFNEQYENLNLDNMNIERLMNVMIEEKTSLNNLFMAGLGASTLILRLGAIIQLSKKLKEGTPKEDALLIKQIVENLSDNLPSDTSWKIIWYITCADSSPWKSCVTSSKGHQSLIEKFITFRNKYVHGYISLREQDVEKIASGINTINKIVNETSQLFSGSEIKEHNNQFFFLQGQERVPLHPFLQKGSKDGLPYVFQGLYNDKVTAELISTYFGDIERQEESTHYASVFEPMREVLKGGAGRVFDHSNRIAYYSECFVGRDQEIKTILDWVVKKDGKNILPIFSSAGMGKGALIANVIQQLSKKEINIPTLYHFCGSGIQNSLHATLYHFIIQGNKQQLWKTDDEEILMQLKRLPIKYSELIMLFHKLLDECFTPSKKNSFGNLAIVLDGLDEAQIAYPQLNIYDWFNNYDENGESTGHWLSASNIKWIFTYRKGFYKFPDSDNNFSIDILQPLVGLSPEAARNALSVFNPSENFLTEMVIRGQVSE